MINLALDGRPTRVAPGTTIWEAAAQLGIAIPALCHSPRLRPVGVCRLCMGDVGGRVLAASCVRPYEEGMTELDPLGKIPEFKFCAVRLEPEAAPL
jgi:NADH dehydrogenase/NADH:ubiquinone oxidoreductase subunit G